MNSQLQNLKTARQRLKAPAWVTPEALNVSPELLHAQLAKPSRRLVAIGIDLLLIAMLSGASNIWLVAGLVLMALQFRKKQTATTSKQRKWVVWLLCIGFLWLGVQHGKDFWEDQQDEQPAASAKAKRSAAAARKAKAVAEAIKQELDKDNANKDGSKATAASEPVAPSAASSAASLPTLPQVSGTSDADRIAELEAQLEEARQPKVFRWREEAKRWLDGLGVGFGWAIVYFSLLPAWLQGQTLGKKIMRLRVVELTGKPLNVMTCFSRYGGYAAGMATGMMGFAQVLWDVNRQAIQDKIAHTVVIDLRAPRRPSADTAGVAIGVDGAPVQPEAPAQPQPAPSPATETSAPTDRA